MIKIDELIKFLELKKAESEVVDRKTLLREFNTYNLENDYRDKFNKILSVVSDYTGIAPEKITSKTSIQEIAHARHLAMFFIKTKTGLSPNMVGRLFSTKRHVFSRHTVLWGIEKLNSWYEVDKRFKKEFTLLGQKIDELNLN